MYLIVGVEDDGKVLEDLLDQVREGAADRHAANTMLPDSLLPVAVLALAVHSFYVQEKLSFFTIATPSSPTSL